MVPHAKTDCSWSNGSLPVFIGRTGESNFPMRNLVIRFNQSSNAGLVDLGMSLRQPESFTANDHFALSFMALLNKSPSRSLALVEMQHCSIPTASA
jgi:hypothetical protein